MIKVNVSDAVEFITNKDLKTAREKASNAFEKVKNGTVKGPEWLGWRRILAEPNDAELEKIDRHAQEIRQNADVFIICGIGGSFAGAKAIIDALQKPFKTPKPEIIYAGHHMGGNYLENLIAYLSEPKEDGEPKSVYLNVISKSGSTLETALSFRILRKWMNETYEDTSKRIIATTGAEGGVLNKVIKSEGYSKYIIPDDVGGRFSVLTPVGLLPVAVAGIDIQTLYYGAVSEYEKNEENPEALLDYAAARFLAHENGKAIDVLGSFEPELSSFSAWTQQLLGESEGKNGKGLFTSIAEYSTDLHSIGQMIQQGRRNILETLLVIKNPVSALKVPQTDSNIDQLDYLNGKSLHEINKFAREGTSEAHREGGVPVIQISLDKLNAQQLGELIYFYELFTAIYVTMLDENPFNQPGVEDYKSAMFRLLGK